MIPPSFSGVNGGKYSSWPSTSAFNFHHRHCYNSPSFRYGIQVCHIFYTYNIVPACNHVYRKWRRHAVIGRGCVYTNDVYVSVIDEPCCSILVPAWEVKCCGIIWGICVECLGFVRVSSGPTRVHEDHSAIWYPPVRAFPCLEIIHGNSIVWVALGLVL